jgi:hypothetical protein
MSFFELDGGKAKPKTKKSTKPSSGKKKAKKGGNFLGTVSELFAPAGWESFVTAAGLLALDRTDNFLRKKKDSKKQKGGEETHYTEEKEMTGGSRKRRTQRGGSDGHHTVEYLDSMGDSEDQDMNGSENAYQPDQMDSTDDMDQSGGAKKRSKAKPKAKSKPKVKKVVRKQKGGAFTPDQEQMIYNAYLQSDNPNKNKITNNSTYNPFIKSLLTGLGYSDLINDVNEAKLIIDTKKIEADIRTFSGNYNNTVRAEPPPNTRRSTNIMSAKQKLQAAQQKLAEFRTGALTEIDSGSLSSTFFNKNNNIVSANKQAAAAVAVSNAAAAVVASNTAVSNAAAAVVASNTAVSNAAAAVVASNAGLFNEGVNQGTGLSGGKKSKKTVKKPTAKKAPKKAPKKK